MGIKGSATIELTNADGSKQIVKHGNMITNALNDLLVSQRGEIAPLFKIADNGNSIARLAFGGLLLFNDTLNQDANDYFLPSTKITGYASLSAYGGLDTARGSFNESESGLQADGKSYKFVWDFSTSQGNGSIKSLALCPNIMGQIGASDSIVNSEHKDFYMNNAIVIPFNNDGNMLNNNGNTDNVSNYNYKIVAVQNDIAYAIDMYNINKDSSYSSRHITQNGGKLKLYKFKLCAKNISILDSVGMARYLGYDEVVLPTDFVSNLYSYAEYCLAFSFDFSSGKLLAFPCYLKTDCTVNNTIQYLEIDLKNGYSITQYTFTNNTAGTIKQDGRCDQSYCLLNYVVLKNHIVALSVSDGVKKLYTINRTDNTNVKQAKFGNGIELTINKTYRIEPIFWSDNVLVLNIGAVSSSNENIYILDLKTGEVRKTNAQNMSVFSNVDIGSKVLFAKVGSYLSYTPTVNPFIVTTKNNLDSAVTKTASQTMKITYTLTETS